MNFVLEFFSPFLEPDESKLEERSPPEINEDLFSYYQIYSATTALDFIDQVESSNFKELSCVQVNMQKISSCFSALLVLFLAYMF